LQIPLKEGIGGEREDDFMDNFSANPTIQQHWYDKTQNLPPEMSQKAVHVCTWEKHAVSILTETSTITNSYVEIKKC
jgi:hypothetical protein